MLAFPFLCLPFLCLGQGGIGLMFYIVMHLFLVLSLVMVVSGCGVICFRRWHDDCFAKVCSLVSSLSDGIHTDILERRIKRIDTA